MPSPPTTARPSSTATGQSPQGPAQKALVLLHRGHEHSGRLQHIVDELALDEFACFAWDARGHGRSPGPRGDSPGIADSVKDLDVFVRHLEQTHGIPRANMVVLAQSVGAVLAATWAHDYAPAVRGLVLTAPAFKVKLYIPLARPALALWYRLRGNFFISSYVKAKFLTHDPERIASYDADPLITRDISARVLLGLYDAAERVVADAQAIRLPTQVLISDSDWVVHTAPQETFFANLGRRSRNAMCCPASFTTPWGRRNGSGPSPTSAASSPGCSPPRRNNRCRASRCWKPIVPATPMTRNSVCVRRCRCCHPRMFSSP